MKGLRVLLAAMLATAAVVPLLIYGVVSVYTLRVGTRRAVTEGNTNVATQAAAQVRRYLSTNLQIFQALAVDLHETGLSTAQQDFILKSFALRFPEFRELTLFGADGRQVASSRVGRATPRPARGDVRPVMGVAMSPVIVDDDFLPTATVEMPVGDGDEPEDVLVGQFSIEELWRMVDRIRVGERGYTMIVGPNGELLAHGNPADRPRVARGERIADHAVVRAARAAQPSTPVALDVTAPDGAVQLTVGVRIPELDWILLVEQPQGEAFALARRQERELLAAIATALAVVIVVGVAWARSLIDPIEILTSATRRLAAGQMDHRVTVTAGGEIGQLGQAFNVMADRLVQLQEDVRRQERHAIFGRVAAGLVHDLSHPFKNVHNNCKLIVQMYDDPDYRALFTRTTEREFSTVRRVFEDLRNLAKPMAIQRVPLDLNRLVLDTAESTRAGAVEAGLALDVDVAPAPAYVAGDMFALGRVCRNLIVNAIEATPAGGRVSVATALRQGQAVLEVRDTGCGIAPERLATLFDDFTTTKRSGLGLGLAISRKIVDQLGGSISAASTVGTGTVFTVAFPAIDHAAAHDDQAGEPAEDARSGTVQG